MATLSMSAAAAIGAPCNRRSGRAASCAPRSITSRWRREHRPGMSRGQPQGPGQRPPGAPPRPARRQARRCAATNGSATELRTATRVARPVPQPVFRPGGGHKLAAGRALSRPRSAERSEGSLDRRSPPHCYTFIPPGRAGVSCFVGAPWGADGAQAPRAARASRPRLEREHGDGAGWAGQTAS